jgi:hypothetical protein
MSKDSCRLDLIFGAATLLLLPISSAIAQETQPALQVRTSIGQTTFHIGERIPLTLSFTGPEDQHYEISLASYDRSGRMTSESFEVTPSTGWSDPLIYYFAGVGSMGGLSSVASLSSKPIDIPLNLNEWIRFDQPGTYRVTITSGRVGQPAKNLAFGQSASTTLKSNTIELHIVAATQQWQTTTLSSILQQLNKQSVAPGIQPEQRTEAIADLRYLATKEAIDQLAADLREDKPDMMYQCAFGLIGLPASMRQIGLEAMNRKVDDPHFPISTWFLITLSVLQADPDGSPSKSAEERQSYNKAAWQIALSALPRKEGKARADTVETLLSFQQFELTPQMKAQLASVMSSSFLDLPEEKQTSELLYNWDILRSHSMLPIVQTLAKRPLPNPGVNLSPSRSRLDLKSAAFLRWFQLDPEGAQREILAEIGSSSPSLTANALFFLPKQPLPQFESVWAQALLKTGDYQQETVLASLLARFGSGAAAPQVRSKLQNNVGNWACAPQAASLAYLLRFDPDEAKPLLKQAIDARGKEKTGCNHEIFQDISSYTADPGLTEAAIEAINDPDNQVANDALIYLMSYGTMAAQKPIADRYTQWTDAWAGKGDELEHRETGSIAGNWQERALGENLGHALIASQGWLADENLISHVLQRCVGDQMCQQLRQIAATARPPYNVILFRSGVTENYQVAQYTTKSLDLLEEKIGQFPKGTTFVLIPTSPQNTDQKDLDTEVDALFTRNGMSLQSH